MIPLKNSCLQGQQSCDIRGTDPLTNSYLWDCLCCRGYKKQIEEAEEIAALNLAKFRQTQTALMSSAEGADLTEQALAKLRAQATARGSSLGPVSIVPTMY